MALVLRLTLVLLLALGAACSSLPAEDWYYVADTRNDRLVRMRTPDGTGWESFGTSGSGPGQFSRPTDVAVDRQGRVYVADMGNRRVVRMDDFRGGGWAEIADATGQVFETPLRVALHPANGDLFVVDYNLNHLVRIRDMDRSTMKFYKDGWRTMDMPADLAFDRLGRMYVPNDESCRLIRISDLEDYTGQSWEVWDGAEVPGPVPGTRGMIAVAIGSDDSVYLVVMAGDEVVRLDQDLANPVRFGRRGTGVGELYDPRDLAFDERGRILILDAGNDRIVRMDDITGAGWTELARGRFRSPWGLTRPASLVQAVVGPAPSPSEVPKRIHLRGPEDQIGGRETERDPRPPAPPPRPLGSLREGEWLVVADTYNHRLAFLGRAGRRMVFRTLGRRGSGRLEFNEPRGLTVDPQGRLVVVDTENHRLVRIDGLDGRGWITYDGKKDGHDFSQIGGLAAEPGTGRLFVSDPNRHALVRVDGMEGGHWTVYGDGGVRFRNPDGVAFDGEGRLYTVTTDTDFHLVRIADLEDTAGKTWEFYDGADIRPLPGFRDGSGVAVGPGGAIFATDPTNDRVVQVDADFRNPRTVGSFGLGKGEFFTPLGVAVAADGRVFVVDSGNHRLASYVPRGSRDGRPAGWWEVGRAGRGDWEFDSPSFACFWTPGTPP